MSKTEINQETVEDMVDIAERLNYRLKVICKDGSERLLSYREVAMVMRNRIELLVKADGSTVAPIMFSDIDNIVAGTPDCFCRTN
jgi:hypothetical protein